MLHLVSQSPIINAVLARIGANDEMVFLDNAVIRLLQTGDLNNTLSQLIGKHRFYALEDDLLVRGITAKELIDGIEIIDYAQLVTLTVKHPVIQSWT